VGLKDELFQSTIESLQRVLALLGGADKAKHIAEAEKIIDDAYQKFTGADAFLFKSLGSEELINILSTNNSLDREKAFVLGVLFKADAELADAKNNSNAVLLKMKALDLLIEAALELDVDNANEYIEQLKVELKDYDLSEKTEERLFEYDRVWGNYAEAEDRLFGFLANRGASQELLKLVREFYAELKTKEKEDLEKGGLPFEELDEGLNAFEEQFSQQKTS